MLADLQEMEVIFRKFSLISLRKITHNCLHLVLRPLNSLHFHVPPGEVSKIQCRMYNVHFLSRATHKCLQLVLLSPQSLSFHSLQVRCQRFSIWSFGKATHNCLQTVLRPLHSLSFHVPPSEMPEILYE